MKKILLCTLLIVFFNMITPETVFSHPYDEPSKSQTTSAGE